MAVRAIGNIGGCEFAPASVSGGIAHDASGASHGPNRFGEASLAAALDANNRVPLLRSRRTRRRPRNGPRGSCNAFSAERPPQGRTPATHPDGQLSARASNSACRRPKRCFAKGLDAADRGGRSGALRHRVETGSVKSYLKQRHKPACGRSRAPRSLPHSQAEPPCAGQLLSQPGSASPGAGRFHQRLGVGWDRARRNNRPGPKVRLPAWNVYSRAGPRTTGAGTSP